MKQLCSKLWPVLMALALLMSFGTTVRADGDSISVPIEVEVNGETILSITPGSGSPAYPNPTLPVVDTTTLEFVFTAPGDYSYTVKQAGTDPSIIYDDTEYLIQIHLELNGGGTLEGTVSLNKVDSSSKESKILFGNSKTEEESKTITRTITYTEYTPDGKEVSVTLVQTVTLTRTKITNPDGSVSYGDWQYESGDISAVNSPPYPGWTPNISRVGTWEIDLNDPKSVVIHVVYNPTSPGPRPDTGDDFWTGWFVIFGIAAAGLAGLLVFAGKKNSKDSREDQ